MARRARFYNWIHHPTKPKLFGGNIGMFRADYERLNGYDENFRGWGCEDDDLRLRIRAAGMKIRSILKATCTYHLWHPRGETTPERWRQGANVAYLQREDRPSRCENGLSKYRSNHHPVAIQRFTPHTVSQAS
jgi:GT2 family glycosyltransferase